MDKEQLTGKKLYWTLFSSTFVISAFTVGGGMVIIPLMKKKFVEELHWIEEEEMMDMVAIAQSAPGVMAVNASIIIGYRLAGVLGALITVLGTTIPPLVTVSLISYFYKAFASNAVVAMALRGMQAGVAAVMINISLDLLQGIWKTRTVVSILLLLAAVGCALFTEVNIVYIILACGICGGVYTYFQTRGKGQEGGKA